MSYYWRPYVPVAQRRANALRKMEKLRKQGMDIQPIEIEGRTIARSFWGKAWCDHLESFSDYENRLPRGRTYVRNGSVCHLEIQKGRIEAMVSGSELYKIVVDIKPLKPSLWKSIKKLCSGKIGSMLELLQGRLSDQVMSLVTHRNKGLMPLPNDISLNCSCPDWAVMCKHVAAVMYGIGSRLDIMPELLFTLRGVNADELIAGDIVLPVSDIMPDGKTIADDKISDIFGIEMEPEITDCQKDDMSDTAKKPGHQVKRKNISSRANAAKAGKAKKRIKKTFKVSAAGSSLAPNSLPRLRPTGNSVKKLRKKLGLSVFEFAEKLGVSSATIYNWEKKRGRLNLQDRSLAAITKLHLKAVAK